MLIFVSGTCVWYSRSTFAMTRVEGRTAPANFAHRNRPIPVAGLHYERITRRPVLGDLINEYEQAA
jgi:hypothetical protein